MAGADKPVFLASRTGGVAADWSLAVRLLVLLVAAYLVVVLVWVVIRDGGHVWKTGDWLINYQGGLVRRGLWGEMIYRTRALLDPVWLTTALQVLVFLLLVREILRWVTPRDSLGWGVVLSPLLMFFYLYDHAGSMRKEMLGMLFIALALRWQPLHGWRSYALAVLSLVMIFSHEINLFVLPFWGYALFRTGFRPWSSWTVMFCLILVPALFVAMLLHAPSDGGQVAARICASYEGQLRPELCRGAISAMSMRPDQAVYSPYILIQYRSLLLGWLIGGLPFLVAWRAREISGRDLAFFYGSVLFLTPVFLVGGDWGRWIHFAFFMNAAIFFRIRKRGNASLPWYAVAIYVSSWSVCHSGCGLGFGVADFIGQIKSHI